VRYAVARGLLTLPGQRVTYDTDWETPLDGNIRIKGCPVLSHASHRVNEEVSWPEAIRFVGRCYFSSP